MLRRLEISLSDALKAEEDGASEEVDLREEVTLHEDERGKREREGVVRGAKGFVGPRRRSRIR